MGRTTELRRELKRRFYPVAERHGFILDMQSAPFGIDFRRISPASVDVFDLQWEKYGRPRFVVNFGKCPGGGATHLGERFPPDRVLSYMGPVHGRLQPGSGTRTTSWFSQDRPLLQQLLLRRGNRSPAAVVDSLLTLFPELEEWFQRGAVGPHLRLSPNPWLREAAALSC
jgi:hypothetical protein